MLKKVLCIITLVGLFLVWPATTGMAISKCPALYRDTGIDLPFACGADHLTAYIPPQPPPPDPCDPNNPTDQCDHYQIYQQNGKNIRWPAATALSGIHYFTLEGQPNRSSILDSFRTWQTASNQKIKFFDDAYGPIVSDPLAVSDGVNSVSFGTLGTNLNEGWYQDLNGHWGYLTLQIDTTLNGVTGATRAWADPNTGLIYEADTVINSGLTWTTTLPAPQNTYYLPNTMVHEAGHWLDLADLCINNQNCGERELTMYQYSGGPGITKYSTLGKGDISGVKAIYP